MSAQADVAPSSDVPDALAFTSATALVADFRTGAVSPVDVVDAVLARAERTEPVVNALTETIAQEARASARAAQEQYAAARSTGEPTPPLLGIPVATKEKHGIAGRRLSEGIAHRRDLVAAANHPVIDRILDAGGIVHARTTTPEFSCATVTHSPLWGVTRNPWNLAASPGGSSGGAGAALAAGSTVLATGSDIGGSIRIPAGFTGTVGYKSPYGRVPGLAPLSLDPYRSDGAMARTVADTLLLARVVSGVHSADHSTVPGTLPEVPDPDRPVEPDLTGVRIGLCASIGSYPVAPRVRSHTIAFAGRLESLGARIIEVELPWEPDVVFGLMFAHFGHLLAPQMRRLTTGHEHELAAYTRRFLHDAFAEAQQRSFLDCTVLEAAMQAQLADAMADVDVLLCPTNGVTRLEADRDYVGPQTFEGRTVEQFWSAHMTQPFNVCNRCPVLAVPTGVAADGVPTSAQIVGHPYDESTVFRVGLAAEAAGFDMPPWPDIRPL